MKMTSPSFPKLPRLGMPFLVSIFAGDVECLLTWISPLLLLTAKHAGTWNADSVGLQFSTLCLSGIHSLFHRVWQILSCVLGFPWFHPRVTLQTQSLWRVKRRHFTLFPLLSSFDLFSLMRHLFIFWLTPFSLWTTFSIVSSWQYCFLLVPSSRSPRQIISLL